MSQLKPLLELPGMCHSARNILNSAASTRRSSDRFQSEFTISQHSKCMPNELSDYQDFSPKGDTIFLNTSCESEVNSLADYGNTSMMQPLDRAYFKQLRVEREQRQANENQREKARCNSIVFDNDMTIKSRVTQRLADKSIERMGEAIDSSTDALELYRNWQNNFKNLCNRKLNKLAARKVRARSMSKVQPAALLSTRSPSTNKSRLPTIMKPVLKQQLSSCNQGNYTSRRGVQPRSQAPNARTYLPTIVKPTVN